MSSTTAKAADSAGAAETAEATAGAAAVSKEAAITGAPSGRRAAVILAGGLGTRLRPFTKAIPKPLLPIGEHAGIEIQIDRLAASGFTDIYIATNYKAEYISRFVGDGSSRGIRIHLSKEDVPLGTAGPLKLIEDELAEIGGPFLVINGDILTLTDFDRMYRFADAHAEPMVIGVREYVSRLPYGEVSFEGDVVTRVTEKPTETYNVMAGIYCMRPEALAFVPEGTYFNMDTLIHALMADGRRLLKCTIDEYWLDIGRQEDYDRAQEDYLRFFEDLEDAEDGASGVGAHDALKSEVL